MAFGDTKEEAWVWLVLLHIKRCLKLPSNYFDVVLLQVTVYVCSVAAGVSQGFLTAVELKKVGPHSMEFRWIL